MKDDEFKLHIKTLSIDELKDKLDGMLELDNIYEKDPLIRFFLKEDDMNNRKQWVREELDKRIEQEIFGDGLD